MYEVAGASGRQGRRKSSRCEPQPGSLGPGGDRAQPVDVEQGDTHATGSDGTLLAPPA